MPEDLPKNLIPEVSNILERLGKRSEENLQWLHGNMHPYFFITMGDEPEALAGLAAGLDYFRHSERLILADTDETLILARPDLPGSLYDTLRTLQEREISYTEIVHSETPLPGLDRHVEIQTYRFGRKTPADILAAGKAAVPEEIRGSVRKETRKLYPDLDLDHLDRYLDLIWHNNERYVRSSPARRVARLLNLYYQGNRQGGVRFEVEKVQWHSVTNEYRVMFAAGNPPQKEFLLQIMEIFNRLNIGIRRSYCLTISNEIHPYFLGTFYARTRDPGSLLAGSPLAERLRNELYNSLILSTDSITYREFVTERIMCGEDASLVNAFISFCHTNLAHSSPDIFELESVQRAFTTNPEITLKLVELFRYRFDPSRAGRDRHYARTLKEARSSIERYNTGHRHLDGLRKTIFGTCLSLITHTLKTNFFVPEKQALAFRIDPAYLTELDTEFTADLPGDRPFRITYFFGRYGAGYHVGFSDIARGGWRTILAREKDSFALAADTLFKEVYVLAHTQHLKNKDIYEGGSKMAVVLDAEDLTDAELVTQRMYNLQYGLINAFLDIFITEGGRPKDGRIVDYYGEDEPIELGPDENLHDEMVEEIARLSTRRGYILGPGIISSKKVGINHKEYGVTSTGIITFAEITMASLDIDMGKDPFTVKITGGPDGDVAGNAIRLLLERCPRAKINLILDGSGALYDPEGANRAELKRILFKGNIDAFRPSKLRKGAFLLYRSRQKRVGLARQFRRVEHTGKGPVERWVSVDEFHREFDELVFRVQADLFIPAGGRPETVNGTNVDRFFLPDGSPTAAAIVEGANSFITPDARTRLQERGVIVMKDASANKCGVISSSYEVIANLLMSDGEFLANKERYVRDVLEILERRADDEARLILTRHREKEGVRHYTQISDDISREINTHYSRLFELLRKRPDLTAEPLFRKALYAHLPRMISESRRFRSRLREIPEKYVYAIMASEIASSLVYKSNREIDFVDQVRGHLKRVMGGDQR
ncbi:MAG: NAD-glutamate dehydrogenase [bacterium]|nr:NAD-glutamate dehydrogenase [bacterium]